MGADRAREASAHRMAERHANHRRQPRGSPGRVVEKRRRHRLASPPAQLSDEGLPARPNSPKGADCENDEPHARRQRPILGSVGVGGDGAMGGESEAVGVVGGDV